MKRIKLHNSEGTIVLRVRPMYEILDGHLLLMKKMQAAIDSGEANSEKCVTGFMRELFYILFGADGCAALLAWCGNDYNAAMEAIEPYYSKIHSKLQRIVDKGGYK